MTVMLVVRRRVTELALLLRREEGQAVVEYALLVALIALVAFGAVNEFGLGVSKLFSKVVAHYPS